MMFPNCSRLWERSARLLETPIDPEGATEIARRRAAGRRALPIACYAGYVTMRRCGPGARHARSRAKDRAESAGRWISSGLDEIDQKIMRTVLEKFGGGPVGIGTIAASIGEEPTIEEVHEPVSDSTRILHRSPRGPGCYRRRV